LRSLVIVCALASTAGANPDPDEQIPDEPPTHQRLFGFRLGGGMQPYDGRELTTMSVALAVEHRVYGKWRVAGEYEYLWIGEHDTEPENSKVTDGNGHRTNLLIRRALMETGKIGGHIRFYADVELGGGFLLASEPMAGTIAKPHAFAGVRLGYSFIKLKADTRASAVWEPEVLFRVIAMPNQQAGYFFGIGMSWGD
jgi:hypothetical protein